MKIHYHVLDNSIVLNYDAKTLTISNDDDRYAAVLQAIRDQNLEEIPALVETERKFEGSGIALRDGLLWEGQIPLPAELSERILKFKALNLPYTALLKFWENLKLNPSFNARKMMFKFLEHNGHPLTEDGCFIAYRGVTEDFKDRHSRSFDNAPGSVCEMPRELVDDNPKNTCSAGLHVACFDYAKAFASRLVEVKVNPIDVVCVPEDYNGTKMRTCKFEVVQECAAIRNELVYGNAKSASTSTDSKDDSEEDNSWEDEADKCEASGCETDADDCSDHCQSCGEDRDSFANFCDECGNEF